MLNKQHELVKPFGKNLGLFEFFYLEYVICPFLSTIFMFCAMLISSNCCLMLIVFKSYN
jgi:hypothetical protein